MFDVILCQSPFEFLTYECAGGYLSELITSLDHSGAKYTVLYVSDPYNSMPYSPQIGRLLAENASGNASLNSTAFCDGVCQVKKTLLEAIFVVSILTISTWTL